jgi:GDPmannose 4,6-dehydratase
MDYRVIGTRRGNAREVPPEVEVVYGDVTDSLCIRELADKYRPDEIYNLAGLSHVGDSFQAMAAVFHVNATGAANCLDAAARIGAKFYQASTSEMFGSTEPPQSETSLMQPRSPYAVAKLSAYWLTRNYRERGVFAAQGILFNHESPRRPAAFVTQKVCKAVADIVKGKADHVTLGNLDACRDWGHAKDYVRAMWTILQAEKPDDYVVATGQMRSVRDLCKEAFGHVGLDYRKHVVTSDAMRRPLEVEKLCGDAAKIRALGWEPEITFEQMIRDMMEEALNVNHDIR